MSSTALAFAFRSSAIAGRAGRYMSSEKGARIEMAPSRINSFENPGCFDIAPGSALDRAVDIGCL